MVDRVIVAERGFPLLASVLVGSAAAGGAGLLILPSPVGIAAVAASVTSLAAGVSLYRGVSRKYSRLLRLSERVEVVGGEVRIGVHGRVGVGWVTVYCTGWRSVYRSFRVVRRYSGPVSLRLPEGYTLLASGRRVYAEIPAACITSGELRGLCVGLVDPYSSNVREARFSLVAACRGSVAEASIVSGPRGLRGVLRMPAGDGRAALYMEAWNRLVSVRVRVAETRGGGGERGFSYSFRPGEAKALYMDQATVTPYALLRVLGLQRPLLSGFSSASLRLRLVLESRGSREERSIGLNAWRPREAPSWRT